MEEEEWIWFFSSLYRHTLTAGENVGRVGIHVIGGDHPLGPQNLGPLIVPVTGLSANVNHRHHAVFESHNTRGRIETLRIRQILDGFVDVRSPRGHDIYGTASGHVAGHIQIVDRHILEQTAAALDILLGWRSGIPRRELDLKSNTTKNETKKQ